MGVRSSPIFENRVFVEPESLGDYEAWAGEQADRARQLAGITGVDLFEIGPDERGWPGRAVQFSPSREVSMSASWMPKPSNPSVWVLWFQTWTLSSFRVFSNSNCIQGVTSSAVPAHISLRGHQGADDTCACSVPPGRVSNEARTAMS